MKKILILILFLYNVLISFSQPTFEYLFSSPMNEIANSLIEDGLGNIYFPVENSNYGLIIKLSNEGVFVDSVHLVNPEGTCNLSELIKLNQNQFIALGNWTVDSISALWFVILDYNLGVLDNKILNSYGYKVFDFRHILNNNGNIVFIALYKAPQSPYNECIYEIKPNGIVIRDRFFSSFAFNQGFTLLELPDIFSYKVFSFYPLSSRGSCFSNVLDSNFNVIDTGYFNEYIQDLNTAKWIDDSTYILSGKKYDLITEEWDLGILKVTKEDSILSSSSFGKTDTIEWPGLYKNLDFITTDNIFYAGSSNSYIFPFQSEPSWIMLNIIDSELNIKSQHYYGGDAFYLVNAILTTQDSGCVIACSRYDWLTQDNEFDVYIIKVDKDGLLVSINENKINNGNKWFMYPNPAGTSLNIRFPEERITNNMASNIEFFDVFGVKIKEVETPSLSEVTINVQDLSIGIYIVNIKVQGEIVSSKKLVIAR